MLVDPIIIHPTPEVTGGAGFAFVPGICALNIMIGRLLMTLY